MTASATPATPAVEREVFVDLARRAALVAPVAVLIGAAFWGTRGAAATLFGLAVVLLNFGLSALILTRATRLGPAVIMGGVLGGFILRMGLVVAALVLVRDASWVHRTPLAITLLASHLGLLVWEARHLSISLAFPGLKPPRGDH